MTNNRALRPVKQTRLSDQAYEVLRDSILRKELAPGLRLDLDALQVQLGISRTPLKDAINQLATEGLVTVIPRRGSYVTAFTVESVAERFGVREMLELGSVGQVLANLAEKDVQHLQRLYESWHLSFAPDGLGLVSDYFRFLDKDTSFHRAMIQVTGNNLLCEIYDGLNLNLQLAVMFYPMENKRLDLVDLEHQQILRALQERDAGSLASAMKTHIRESRDALIELIKAENQELTAKSMPPGEAINPGR